MKCEFCERPAIGRCGWPSLRFVVVETKELRIGEIIRRWNEDQPRSSKVARVTALLKMAGGSTLVKFTIYPAGGKTGPVKFKQQFLELAKAERRAPCHAPVCEAHARELDENKHQCAAHWNEWEKVA